jgi:hypothetical protein
MTTFIVEIAAQIAKLHWCEQHDDERHKQNAANAREMLTKLQALLPSGSGIDRGTVIRTELSSERKVVFDVDFHHMIDGLYDGWQEEIVMLSENICLTVITIFC